MNHLLSLLSPFPLLRCSTLEQAGPPRPASFFYWGPSPASLCPQCCKAPKGSTDRQLAGLSISAGVVRGRVKVLRTAAEKRLLPGEILVARATDPGWTPLFMNAGGIILEIGGVLQHGAVVAREYGIPCVSGISRATEILRDGQLVELDASNGIVRLLQEGA